MSESARKEFLEQAVSLLGQGAVKTAPFDIEPYAIDWRKRYVGCPLAVLLPSNTGQVAQIVQLANQHHIALVPQGGNTGLSGGATPDGSGAQVIVSLIQLTGVRSKDAVNKTLSVEAGVTLKQVQEIADSMGLLFPLSLGAEASATIGGNLATNAGGTAVLRYGNARELCLGLEVVTPSGEIWDGLRGLRKDNTGYDLRDLLIGSEGTLGIITAAVLKLYPQPAAVITAIARVRDSQSALQLLQLMQSRAGAAVTGFEYMSAASIRLVKERLPDLVSAISDVINESDCSDCVLVEISHSESEYAAIATLEQPLADALQTGLIENAIVAQSGLQADQFWRLRESITLAAADDGPHVKHDIALPISSLSSFITVMDQELCGRYPGIRCINFGHFGDGNLHYNIAPPAALATGLSREDRHRAFVQFIEQNEGAIRRSVHDRVISMNGSISAEHGLGQLRRDEAWRYKSSVERGMMLAIKQALDPMGILNPGKVL